MIKNDHRYLPIIAIRRGAKKIREVLVKSNDRVYGKSKYGSLSKVVKGIPEVFLFLIRLKRGMYDMNIVNTK